MTLPFFTTTFADKCGYTIPMELPNLTWELSGQVKDTASSPCYLKISSNYDYLPSIRFVLPNTITIAGCIDGAKFCTIYEENAAQSSNYISPLYAFNISYYCLNTTKYWQSNGKCKSFTGKLRLARYSAYTITGDYLLTETEIEHIDSNKVTRVVLGNFLNDAEGYTNMGLSAKYGKWTNLYSNLASYTGIYNCFVPHTICFHDRGFDSYEYFSTVFDNISLNEPITDINYVETLDDYTELNNIPNLSLYPYQQ